MDETTQTTTSTPTGQAGAAGSTPATTGETKTEGTPTAAAPGKGTLLTGAPEGEKKDPGKEQGQTSGENKTTPAAGAELEVKLPEGMAVDQTMLDAFMPAFKDAKLSSEQASALAAKYVEVMSNAEKAQYQAWVKQSDDWEGTVKADSEFGGAKLAESTSNARAFLLKYGTPTAIAELNKYGLGNNPELFKMCARAGAAMAEDTTASSKTAGGLTPQGQAERNKQRYPSHYKG